MKKALADALAKRGYETLTPVQEAVTDPSLEGADLLVSAQTGSGKTVGFGLAIASTLLGDAEVFEAAAEPLALVIAPTRELALQVKRELTWLYAEANVNVTSCVGGMDMRDERRALGRGTHIVVATPGRLRDHIERKSLDMSALRAVVLDEADEMLDLGFREDLEFILGSAPEARRTLMFSATVPRAIGKLAASYQKDAVRVTTVAEKSQHSDIDYQGMHVAARDAENAIINVLRFHEAPSALVFCNTRAMVNRLTTRLSNRGFSVVSLSGELSQSERTHALQAMRDGRARVCVATDVAARGIDLPNLDLVVHAELPSNQETLLHRSGRTGRAGRKGVSVMIVPPAARRKAERILQGAKVSPTWIAPPSVDDVKARDEARLIADPIWAEPISETEAATAQRLLDAHDPTVIAAAYVRLYTTRQSAPEELTTQSAPTAAPAPRKPFGPSVWFSVSGGRKQNVEVRRLLPTLCKAGGLTNEDFGAIRIQDTISYVEIRKESAKGFLKALGADMKAEGATVTALDAAPDLGPLPPSKPRPRNTKPRPQARPDTAPIDWDDSPAPRRKKPKPGAKPAPKSKGKPKATANPGVTPVGKPSSKKNRARAKAAAQAKAGNAPPRRS